MFVKHKIRPDVSPQLWAGKDPAHGETRPAFDMARDDGAPLIFLSAPLRLCVTPPSLSPPASPYAPETEALHSDFPAFRRGP